MKSSKRRGEISDSYYVSQTISALFGLLGLAYVLSDVTIWVFGVENKQIKSVIIFIYNVLITFMPGVRSFLSPLMVPELNWQIYRYTGGFFLIAGGFISNKFFGIIYIGLYAGFFYFIAKNDADSKKDKIN
jgi:hypothetical protein